MSTFKRMAAAIGLVFIVSANTIFAITLTVAKSGADFNTITAAIKAAAPGDVVKIIDNETYEEQVTIDSTKYPLTLTSNDPASINKPIIQYQDRINVGPKTYEESKDIKTLTFDQNGALRIMKARNVVIDGIAVNGGGVFPFGYDDIFENIYPLQFGNCGITIWSSGDVIIRNCDIADAFIGINFKDRNVGGIFANPNPADIDTSLNVPISAYGLMGNHLIERNRVHNNSFGIFSESSWDMGSTIRYNLFYENHHPTATIATKVKDLTDEGYNLPGGAFFFKDMQLSPWAIYNNTFYRNFIIFAGHWQAGYQHLVFNNIFGPPKEYWQDATPQFNTTGMELTRALLNRINCCIYSAQVQKPQPIYARIIDSMPALQAGGAALNPGTLWAGTTGFSASANNRWLEMENTMFLSTSPASANFLEPNWADTNVAAYIIQKGWQKSGVKNTDGTWADLGAIEQAHGLPAFTGTIKPVPFPVIANGTTAQVYFTVNERSGAMQDPVIKLFRFVKMKYKMGTFGNNETTLKIIGTDMTDLTIPSTPPVAIGPNSYSVNIPTVGDYAFIEMMIEATGLDGKTFTTAAGFLPYRKLDYKFTVEIHDKTGSDPILKEVNVGDTVQLRLIPQTITGGSFTNPLNAVSVTLVSGFELLVPGNPPSPLIYQGGLPGGPDNRLIMFSGMPGGAIEHISVKGVWKNPETNKAVAFLGGTSIWVHTGATASKHALPPPVLGNGAFRTQEVTVNCFDLQGRKIFQKTFVSDQALVMSPNAFQKGIPPLASKVYLMEISLSDGASLRLTRSVRKIVAP